MVADTIKGLLLVIQSLAGYPAGEAPTVTIMPDAELQQAACGRPCLVKAFYDPERGIFLSQSVDFERDTYQRSILLHELVHHAQRVNGRYEAGHNSCERRNVEELEAYEIQNRYLHSQGDPRLIPRSIISLKCE